MDLVTFLAARYDEKARDADEIHHRDCDVLAPLPFPCGCGVPARVLREVEAGRAILAEHEAWIPVYGPMAGQQICGAESEVEHPCRTLRLLTAVFNDHPDYHEDWCPSTSATGT